MYFADLRGQRDILMAAMLDGWRPGRLCAPQFR